MTRPLEGVTVIEASTMAFVPSAARVLGEWGADVIKIEQPVVGDPMRGSIISGVRPNEWRDDFTLMWETPNQNKRSIALDLARPEGRELLDDLLDRADVFLTNLLPRTRSKLRIDVDDIAASHPRVIYALGSGYGRHGPLADRGGYDGCSYWLRTGIAYEVTDPQASHAVGLPGPAFGDMTAGLTLAGGIAAALLRRERTGEGGTVDVSLLAVGMWSVQASIVAADLLGADDLPRLPREEWRNPLTLNYRTSDGRHIGLTMTQADRFWPKLCEVLGHPELATDRRFVDMEARAKHSRECTAALDEIFATRTYEDWCQRLATQSGPWDGAQAPGEVAQDEQALANGLMQEVDYGGGRVARIVPSPVHFDDQAAALSPAPEFGSSTEEVMLELGKSWEQISQLKEIGAIG
jgi:crotonobetainyl-CoA:carnitine CoA-transferase CaiB-like acyl-CoA transferase